MPKLEGFCGDLYGVEHTPTQLLYSKSQRGVLSVIVPYTYTWQFPKWHNRAKVVVGLLEFVMEAYQHGSDGMFFMCGLSEESVGHMQHYDVRVLNVHEILPKATLSAFLSTHECMTDEDCVYTRHCSTTCDTRTHKCTGDVVNPNLKTLCVVLEDYIMINCPKHIKADLRRLVDRCKALDNRSGQVELQHSLILNDLKLLLWKQIQTR